LGGEPLNPQQDDVVAVVREVTGGYGAAVVVEAVGTAGTRKQAVQAARSTGTIILSGLHEETSAIPAAEIIRREIVIKGSFAYAPANFVEAVRLLAGGAIRMDDLVIEADLSEGGQWFDRLVEGSVGRAKVMLRP
jgi:threonine dehydrogenase-like Zn-dependent dehydrogenase